jgi:molecular chaperone DnaK
VTARNQADNMLHAVTKAVKDAGDKVSADERQAIEKASAALKEVLKSDNKDDIEAKTKDLTDASAKMAERLYAQGQTDQTTSAGQGAGGGAEHEQKPAGEKAENVVDAEFEEVKDDGKRES